MKKLLVSLVITLSILFCISCGTTRRVSSVVSDKDTTELVLGSQARMYFTLDKNLGKTQLDSMIRVDNLTPLNTWIQSSISYNGKRTPQFLYIKSIEEGNELMYTVTLTQCDTIFKCTKRITQY